MSVIVASDFSELHISTLFDAPKSIDIYQGRGQYIATEKECG